MTENQLDVLEKMLIEKGIEYERTDEATPIPDVVFMNGPGEFHQISGETNNLKWDVICHKGSYGYEDGLLEYADNVEDDVIGRLTADKVIRLIESGEYRRGYKDAVNKIRIMSDNLEGGWEECVFGTGS